MSLLDSKLILFKKGSLIFTERASIIWSFFFFFFFLKQCLPQFSKMPLNLFSTNPSFYR